MEKLMFKSGQIITALIAPLSLGVLLVLSGCGDNENRSEVRDPVEYIRESCEYSADEGKNYGASRSTMPVINGYFGKAYNKDWLANVGHTSMRDTVTAIELTGTKVYYSNAISEKSCKNFAFTNKLPSDLGQEWQKNDVRGPKGEFMAGLYLIKGSRNLDSLKTNSAVIIREDANRWTLVHEFMHHNFKSQAVLKGYDDDLVHEKLRSLSKNIATILNNAKLQNREKVKTATPLFIELVDVLDLLTVQYFLEEIAVEATLQDKYDAGDLTFVPAGSYGNATWYIGHSKKKALEMYSSMDELYTKLRDLARFSGANREYFQLDHHKELKEKRLAQLEEMLKEQEDRKFRTGSFNQMQISAPEGSSFPDQAPPCGQAIAIEHQIDELIRSITEIIR